MKKNDQTMISNFLIALLREKDYINYLEKNEKNETKRNKTKQNKCGFDFCVSNRIDPIENECKSRV